RGLGHVLGFHRTKAKLHGGVAVLFSVAHGNHLTAIHFQHGDRHLTPCGVIHLCHADFFCQNSRTHFRYPCNLISTSTPAARSSFMSASMVCGVASRISSNLLCVRISNCSRDFLSTCGPRFTVKRSKRVGSGMGPRTEAPVRLAVFTISLTEVSSTR